MKTTNEVNFAANVLLPSFVGPIAVFFSAEWCGPCKVVKPRIERLSDAAGFPLIGVDAGVERSLASFYGVRGVPTLAVFAQGKLVGQKSGAGNLGEADAIRFLNECGLSISPPGEELW